MNFATLLMIGVTGILSESARAEMPASSIELLNQLIEINSHSENISGLKKMREVLIPKFKDLGFVPTFHPLEKRHELLSFDFPREKPSVLLIAHLDTVFSQAGPMGKKGIEGTKVFGPGIIDMKGGIVVMLAALRELSLHERKKIRIVLNDDEELASVYSRNTISALAATVPYGLVFEPGLPDGSLVTSASGGQWIKLTVKGRAAHAGMEHVQGINACAELAHKITLLHQLTNYSKKLTLNVGVISGGTQPNVVCEEASTTLDIRYVDPKDLQELRGAIERIAKTSFLYGGNRSLDPASPHSTPTSATLETLATVLSMPESSTQALFAIAKQVDTKVKGQHVGYGTDGNHLVNTGIQLLVGLGPYGGGLHTSQEFMEQEALQERIKLSSGLIRSVLKQKTASKFSESISISELTSSPEPPYKELRPALNPELGFSGPSTGSLSPNRFRIKAFTETMSPSLGNGDRFVPFPSGEAFVPAFLSAQVGMDYEVFPNYRFFYLQKGLAILPQNPSSGVSGRFLDPRFGLRRTNFFLTPGLLTEYDLFVQPGLTGAFIKQINRSFDLGMRLTNRYSIPSSNWTIGSNFEMISTFFSNTSTSSDVSGLFAVYGSYRISSIVATQHWFYSFYKHQRGDPLFRFSWDITGQPYLQNGISVRYSKELTLSFLINQYAFISPKLQNMWASLWIAVDLS